MKPEKHGRDHCLGGEDPIPITCLSSPAPWITVYDNLPYGQDINTSSTGDLLEFPYVDWSDNATGTFTYVRSAPIALASTNNYQPRILVDGVYSFTAMEISENLGNAGKDFKIEYGLGVSNAFPGTGPVDRAQLYYHPTNFSTSYFYIVWTWVLPIKASGGLTVTPLIRVIPESGAADFNTTFRNRLYITYLGDVSHSAAFAAHRDPYPTAP